jgi:hypothetical protein
MSGHLGFSYVGLVFLMMLFVPNLIWKKRQPQGYSAENENSCYYYCYFPRKSSISSHKFDPIFSNN